VRASEAATDKCDLDVRSRPSQDGGKQQIPVGFLQWVLHLLRLTETAANLRRQDGYHFWGIITC